MLSEEGLILVAVLAACVLVALGTLELLWPSRPRHLVRRHGLAHDARRRVQARSAAAPARPAADAPMAPPPPPIVVDTPREIPPAVVAAEETPEAPPVITAEETPEAPPVITAEETPEAPPVITAEETPEAPPVITAEETPEAPPVITAEETPEAPPVITAEETPEAPPVITAEETPEAPPVITAEETPEAPPVIAAAEETPEVPPVIVAADETLELPPAVAIEDTPEEAPPAAVAAVAPTDAAPTDVAAPADEPSADEIPEDGAQPARPALRIVSSPATEPAEGRRERPRAPRSRSGPRAASRHAPPVKPAAPRTAPPEPEAPPTEAPAAQALEVSVGERCLALVQTKRFAAAVTLGEAALKMHKSAANPASPAAAAQETARLWGVVGLGKRGLDDFEGARFAFEEAIAVGPRSERSTWERHLAELALTVGRRALDGGEVEPSHPDRIASLRSAIDWLERGLVVAPDGTELRDTLAAARAALWPAYEAVVKALVQRQEFGEALRLADEVLADPDCPPEWRKTVRALLGGVIGGEAERVTGEAVRHLQRGREKEATAALESAEGMIAKLEDGVLPPERREELERRMWGSYLKLGTKRADAGAHEEAASALLRALSLTTIGASRQDVARTMLTRTLQKLVDARSTKIAGLIASGDTAAASTQSAELSTLLRSAVERGVPEADIAVAVDKVRGIVGRLGDKRR